MILHQVSDYSQDLLAYTERLRELSDKYALERKLYGERKAELDLIYASKIDKINEFKKNAGYETGLLHLMKIEGDYLSQMYKEMITHYNNYKAIERMLNAFDTSISSIQSIMRYNRDRDGYGT